MSYTESFYSLSHGTDEVSARKIIDNGFKISGNAKSWCGRGIYFYDIKAKAWWSANRTCKTIKKEQGKKLKPAVVFADIVDIPTDVIFDLRVLKDLQEFEQFISPIFNDMSANLVGVEDETERKILLRALLISYYADKVGCKLVIGHFRQRPQPLYEHAIEFSNSLDMIFGIETIYCVKDPDILENICRGGNKSD